MTPRRAPALDEWGRHVERIARTRSDLARVELRECAYYQTFDLV